MNKLRIITFLSVCTLLCCPSLPVWAQNDSLFTQRVQPNISTKKIFTSAPVVPFYDTLFYIHVGIGTFSPQERALSIADKIEKVADSPNGFQVDSLSVITEGSLTYIVYRDMIIMTITEADAGSMGKTPQALSLEYQTIIRDAIVAHINDTKWLTILLRVLSVVLIVLVQYFLIIFINRLFRKISIKIEQLKGKKIKTIKFKSFVLMDEEKTTKFILFLIKILRYAIILLMLYLSIPMALSVFPATRGVAGILFGFVLSPVKSIFSSIVAFIPNLITIIVIVVVFKYLIKGVRYIAEEIDKGRLTIKGFYRDWAHPTFSIVKTLLYAFMFISIWPYIPGHDKAVFQGVSVFIGVIFTLGSTSIIGNLVSGLVLTYMRPFIIGDRIKIGDLVGNVVEKTPFVTRIRTPKNEEVTIPNSSIMTAQTFNYSQSARTYGLILHSTFTFGYDTPWRKIHEMLLEAAERTPEVQKMPKPFILQTALDDFYAEYQLNVYVVDADKSALIYSNLHQNVQDVFNENGIEITSPHFQTYTKK